MAKLPPIGEKPLVPLLLTEAEAYNQASEMVEKW